MLGTVLQEYLQIASHAYRLGLFFVCSMLALVVLRSLLSFSEKNAADMVRDIVQRVLGLQSTDEVKRRRVRRRLDDDFHEGEGE